MMSSIPALRFPEFKAEWIEKRLEDLVVNSKLGGNYNNSPVVSKYPLIKMGNVERGYFVIDAIEYIQDEIPKDEFKLKKGDLLFNTRNSLSLVGKVAVWRNIRMSLTT